MMELVDVSHYQGLIDWPRVHRSGIVGAIAKATEGTAYVDSTFGRNVRAGRAAGVKMGAYHFAGPDSNVADGRREADHLLLACLPYVDELELRPALDLETTALARSLTDDWALAFCDRVADEWASPVIYTGRGWASQHLEPNPELRQYGLWVASWTTAATPTMPAPWQTYVLWQYTAFGSVPGIAGDADRDRCASLGPLLVTPPAPPAPVTTEVPDVAAVLIRWSDPPYSADNPAPPAGTDPRQVWLCTPGGVTAAQADVGKVGHRSRVVSETQRNLLVNSRAVEPHPDWQPGADEDRAVHKDRFGGAFLNMFIPV